MIYFIRDEHQRVKIGKADNPKTRKCSLQSSNPEKLTMLGCMDGGEMLEAQLHQRFKRYLIRGEWFTFSPEIQEFIKTNTFLLKPKPRPKRERRTDLQVTTIYLFKADIEAIKSLAADESYPWQTMARLMLHRAVEAAKNKEVEQRPAEPGPVRYTSRKVLR